MIVDEKSWLRFKNMLWQRLWEDLEIGYLDKDLLPVLVLLNEDKNVYTLSSCSGRIVVSDSKYPWSREESNIVLKSHIPVEPGVIEKIVGKPIVRRLWLNSTGPIFHLSVKSLKTAKQVLKIARLAGYKHSGILSINRYKGVIIELTTGVRFSTFLGDGSRRLSKEDIAILVAKANEILLYGKLMLNRLYVELSKHMPIEPDETVLRELGNKFKHTSTPEEILLSQLRDRGLVEYINLYNEVKKQVFYP
ncbi:tRNA(Phe) 7-((3-amino-3-carboxypropyl)-4-demethylwyosine(37)-N(4))-methyltransferase [Thermogladius sp. 4427co]|uniref:tRNA(Phe) 7-((3-amino-3-carboxypropyl)-4-demethylwyosine(37)-N(4))- methyltransferase n=1 Tax=Thermogladius sp. 4427co TaxID=3450718 RepID=UPI003F7A31CD